MRRGVRVRLTNLKAMTDRQGKVRHYLRVKGQPLIRLPDLPLDDPTFIAAWAEAMKQAKGRHVPIRPGTLMHLCEAYLRCPDFKAHSPAYQSVLRRHILQIEAKAGDTAQARHLQPKHVKADLAKLAPGVAQARFKAWRALAGFGLATGAFTADPTLGVTRPKAARTDGHLPWTADEVAAFRARWPLGTVQRALFELLHWTGARISDAVRIGPGMVDRDGVLCFRQAKTGGTAYVPWSNPLPAYAAGMAADRALMHQALATCAGHMTFLATRHGRSRSAKAIGGDVSRAATLAGVAKTAHGLRKTRATVLAEAGASSQQIMSWTGHTSLSEVESYSRSASRKRAVMAV